MLRNGAGAGSHESDEGGVGFDRPDHAAVFDLSMEYDEDDVLLDWEQYAGTRAVCACRCPGRKRGEL